MLHLIKMKSKAIKGTKKKKKIAILGTLRDYYKATARKEERMPEVKDPGEDNSHADEAILSGEEIE